MTPLVRTVDRDHCVATWDRVLLQVWRLSTTAEAIENLYTVTRAFMAQERRPISSLAIVESTSPPPSDAVRKALSKYYRELAPKMNAAIVVAEGGGFRAAIVRGVGLTLSMLAPKKLPFTFLGDVNEAAQLLAPNLSSTAGAEGLLSAVQDTRNHIPSSIEAGMASRSGH
jgi:hypothetical protein